MKQRLIDAWGSISQTVIDEAVDQWKKAVTWMCESERTSLWTSAKIKPALFRGTGFFQTTSSLLRKTLYITRHFRRSYLIANKVSRGEETRKVEYTCTFWKYADVDYHKISQSVDDCRNYSLSKLARFLRQCIVWT